MLNFKRDPLSAVKGSSIFGKVPFEHPLRDFGFDHFECCENVAAGKVLQAY